MEIGAHPAQASCARKRRSGLLPIGSIVLALFAAAGVHAGNETLSGKGKAQPLPVAGPRAPAAATDDAPMPFILKSYVFAPEQAGGLSLVGTNYDPDDRRSGVGFEYRDAAAPQVVVSVFVYPLGAMSEAEAMQRGMRDFRANLDAAAQHGLYSDLNITGEVPFETPRLPADDAAKQTGTQPTHDAAHADDRATRSAAAATPSPAATPLDQRIARAVTEATPSAILHGRRLSMTLVRQGTHTASLGYLFYKQLYLIKARISAPSKAMDMAALTALGDRAMRAIVPRIEAVNVGSCGTVVLPTDIASDDFAVRLAADSARIMADNCSSKVEESALLAKHRDDAVLAIHYAAADWISRP